MAGSKTVEITTPDGVADAILAVPEGRESAPGVLMYMDIFGLRPVIRAMAEELAGHGYAVLVPNVFYRHGTAPVIELPAYIGEDERPDLVGQLIPVLQAHAPDRVLRDAEAYLRFLTGRPEVADGPVAATGYCMGAALALRTAAAHPEQVAAVAGFHPAPLVTEAPDSAHHVFPKIAAEVHLGLAEGDMTPESTRELNKTLDDAGIDHATEIYPGTLHGFSMADTGAFDSAALQRHWDRLLPLLGRTLGGS